MHPRLDTPFESWGGFSQTPDGPFIHGRLHYDPAKEIKLELVENPFDMRALMQGNVPPAGTMFGQLGGGTLVTLFRCLISNAELQMGVGIGAPTTLVAHQALFGRHAPNLNQLPVKKYSVELSSLGNWTCASPIDVAFPPRGVIGLDVTCRRPAPIKVPLQDRGFDVEIAHWMKMPYTGNSLTVTSGAGMTITAHESIRFEAIEGHASQCQNLLSLLIGERLSIRAVVIVAADVSPSLPPIPHDRIAERSYQIFLERAGAAGDPDADWDDAERQLMAEQAAVAEEPLHLLYRQVGSHGYDDVHPALMLLPYPSVKDRFPSMIEKWFARSEQAILATNVFFGSQRRQSAFVNDKLLAVAQSVESYHRSLGTGLYMDQGAYDLAIQDFTTHMPAIIEDDHRHSLKNRLKYGNEYSLRKRLIEMFERLAENARRRIAGDTNRFVQKVVDTRNYFTHFDHAAQQNAFAGAAAFIAAERLRILVVANLLHDLGVSDENLLNVLERRQEFHHWMSQPLPL